jgi:hypothetical protein
MEGLVQEQLYDRFSKNSGLGIGIKRWQGVEGRRYKGIQEQEHTGVTDRVLRYQIYEFKK